MILIDDRVGSGDLLGPLKALHLSCELTRLEFGDAAFVGNGPNETAVLVGIEVKRLNDMLSCITSGRFSGHQLPGLLKTYAVSYLIIEGIYRPNPQDGVLETFNYGKWQTVKFGPRGWMYRDLEAFLTTVEIKGGVHIRRTSDRQETARVIASLYSWWTKDFEEHRAHIALNRAHQMRDAALLVPPSLQYRWAAELDGLGLMKAGTVAGHFERPIDFLVFCATAMEKDWAGFPGIGKTLAKRIVAQLNSKG